jgi:hypothetical protein
MVVSIRRNGAVWLPLFAGFSNTMSRNKAPDIPTFFMADLLEELY